MRAQVAGMPRGSGFADAQARQARFGADGPKGLAFVPGTWQLIVADSGNHRIRRVDLGTGVVTTVSCCSLSVGAPQGPPCA